MRSPASPAKVTVSRAEQPLNAYSLTSTPSGIPYDGVSRMLAIRCEFYSEAYGKYVQPVEATRWMSVTYENGETSKYISWREEPVLERGRYVVSVGIRGEDYGIASDHLTLYLSVA